MPVRFFISKELSQEQEERLKEAGVDFLGLSLIKTVPVEFDVSEVLSFRPEYAIFSSRNGVKSFFSRVKPENLRGVKFISVGSSTAAELSKLGFNPVIPDNFSAEGLLELLKGWNLKDRSFLIVRPKKARTLLKDFLLSKGANVLEVVVYQTLPNLEVKDKVLGFFSEKVDYAAFTSPSNFKAFLEVLPRGREVLSSVKIIPIGHVTEKAIKREGLSPLPPPSEYTVNGIIEKLLSLEKNSQIS